MLLFSSYLTKYKISHSSLLNKETRKYHLRKWLSEIALNFQIGKQHKIYEPLAKAFDKWLKEIANQEWLETNLSAQIDSVDQVAGYIYQQLSHYVVLQSKISPISPQIHYPYDAKHSGVSMCAYLVTNTKNGISVHPDSMLEACDALQAKKQKGKVLDEKRAEIKKNLAVFSLSTDAKKLVQRRFDQFHAEDYWFTVQLPKLLKFFNDNKKLLDLGSVQDDDFWLTQLDTFPRLEFVMSSSPCEDCKLFFSDLRLFLNQNKLYLPIIIYCNSPFNTAEVGESPVALIKYDGSYFVTGLSAGLPYYANLQEKIINGSLSLTLFSQEQKAFSQLDSIVNQFMPTIVGGSNLLRSNFIVGLHELFFDEGTVNWNTDCWLSLFFQRLPDGFVQDWEHLNKKVPDEKHRRDFQDLVGHYGPLVSPQDVVNAALIREINYAIERSKDDVKKAAAITVDSDSDEDADRKAAKDSKAGDMKNAGQNSKVNDRVSIAALTAAAGTASGYPAMTAAKPPGQNPAQGQIKTPEGKPLPKPVASTAAAASPTLKPNG